MYRCYRIEGRSCRGKKLIPYLPNEDFIFLFGVSGSFNVPFFFFFFLFLFLYLLLFWILEKRKKKLLYSAFCSLLSEYAAGSGSYR
jgi:apolipoprotein N-acyltransferase